MGAPDFKKLMFFVGLHSGEEGFPLLSMEGIFRRGESRSPDTNQHKSTGDTRVAPTDKKLICMGVLCIGLT